ncbi:MAG: hypothetical protein FJ267_11085, partial [Planctomycetes bacterium]|nr:hypothetical protein [Planctomycetota bacterium]
MDEPRVARVYPLPNTSGQAAVAAITSLFQGKKPVVKSEFDSKGNSLIVIGTSTQHESVEEMLKSFTGGEKELEVFEIQSSEPWSVQDSVKEFFSDHPQNSRPSVSIDYSSGRMFFRGTTQQIQQARQLLVKMGESFASSSESSQTGDVRTIPFRGDSQAAIEELQQIWPRLRRNKIQVIDTSRQGLVRPRRGTRVESHEESDNIHDGLEPVKKVPNENRKKKPRTEGKGASLNRPLFRLVSQTDESLKDDQQSEEQPASEPQSIRKKPARNVDKKKPGETGGDVKKSPKSKGTRSSIGEEPKQVERSSERESNDERPSILILPEEGKITISSKDHEALDQMESLLRTLSRSEGGSNANSNLAVFMLHNTGAGEIQRMLKQLFQDIPMGRGNLGGVVIVADERLNALVVYGNRKERDTIQELLEVLDTDELPNPLVVLRPELLRLENTQARRVRAILSSVYKTQLSTGGGRREVQIPKGVSPEVASVLQQINAAAAGPVLTLDVDETTNSLVMRAPPELSQEI